MQILENCWESVSTNNSTGMKIMHKIFLFFNSVEAFRPKQMQKIQKTKILLNRFHLNGFHSLLNRFHLNRFHSQSQKVIAVVTPGRRFVLVQFARTESLFARKEAMLIVNKA